MSDCLFCKIIAGEIPAYKIYEDEHVFAFLDIAKDADGHTLVVPKTHCRNILDCDSDELAALTQGVQKIAAHYTANCGFEGANIFTLTEPCAGQSVFHLHFHIIPRKTDDGVMTFPKMQNSKHPLEYMHEKLKLM